MDGGRGGSFTPSYKEVVANKSKIPLDKGRGKAEEGRRSRDEETEGSKSEENDGTKDTEGNAKKQRTKDKNQRGPCKPKTEITPRVVLNNPVLQAHRDYMQTYAIICKFMGL